MNMNDDDDNKRRQRILLQGGQSTIFKTITLERSKRSETDHTQLTNAAKRSETDPPKAQAQHTSYLIGAPTKELKKHTGFLRTWTVIYTGILQE